LIDPVLHRLEAKFVYPNNAPIINIVYCPVCRAFHSVKALHTTEVERVNQPKASLGRHHAAERDSGGTLRNTNLYQARPSGCPFL
jgi:hypothetical protein